MRVSELILVGFAINPDSAHLKDVLDGLNVFLFGKQFFVILHDLFILLFHLLHTLEVCGLRFGVFGLSLVLLELNLLLFQVSHREGSRG